MPFAAQGSRVDGRRRQSGRSRLVLLGALALWLAAALALPSELIGLDALRAGQAQLAAAYAAHPVGIGLAFCAIYVATVTLFPWAGLLAVGAGAVFGPGPGVVLVSVSGLASAALGFLAARHLFAAPLRRRLGPSWAERLAAVDRGLERDGLLILFALRLAPVVPFFLISLALGLTRMRLGPYLGVGLLGMLPGTLVFVHAGSRLAEIGSAAELLSPATLGMLVLLGSFPLLARRAASRIGRAFGAELH